MSWVVILSAELHLLVQWVDCSAKVTCDTPNSVWRGMKDDEGDDESSTGIHVSYDVW
jgi:hypothetical protein